MKKAFWSLALATVGLSAGGTVFAGDASAGADSVRGRPVSAERFPVYKRFGPYSYSEAKEKAAELKKKHPKAYIIVRRDNNQGWYVHLTYSAANEVVLRSH